MNDEEPHLPPELIALGFKVAQHVDKETMQRMLDSCVFVSANFPSLVNQFVRVRVEDGVVRGTFGRTKANDSDSRTLVEEANAKAKEEGMLGVELAWREDAAKSFD